MNLRAEIKVFDNIENVYRCFEPEEPKKQDRSFINIKKEKDHVLFSIEAKDITALRASLNSITKLLEVQYKVEELEDG